MTPGQLVKAISIALDTPEEVVVQHDRNLAVAGLRTTGARGRNAPHVTYLDAARVIAATLGSIRTKDSVETVRKMENSRPSDTGVKVPIREIVELPFEHSFVDALASMIKKTSEALSSSDKSWPVLAYLRAVQIHCDMPGGGGTLSIPTDDRTCNHYRYNSPKKETVRDRGIYQLRFVFGETILLMGLAFRDNGLKDYRKATKILDAIMPKPSKTTELSEQDRSAIRDLLDILERRRIASKKSAPPATSSSTP
jgi:hypothetical protein